MSRPLGMTQEEMEKVRSVYDNKFFIETGTYVGNTSILASKYFERVYTMEIAPYLHYVANQQFTQHNINNVKSYLGDSLEILPKILNELQPEGCVFFLDAHQSGPETQNNNKQAVPLYEELDIILRSNIGPSVFVIDDVRLWTTEQDELWKHINTKAILSKFSKRGIKEHYILNDRLYVLS